MSACTCTQTKEMKLDLLGSIAGLGLAVFPNVTVLEAVGPVRMELTNEADKVSCDLQLDS